jgi:hypothetical protein
LADAEEVIMMKRIAVWERKFQVWQYSVSHATLLLRSFHPKRYETRIDVVFPAVSLMHLKPSYATLEIEQVDALERSRFLTREDEIDARGVLYLLNGGQGYVCAAKVSWFEDEGDHTTPSHFGPLRGTD